MKNQSCFTKWPRVILLSFLFIFISFSSFTTEKPELSIVTDNLPGISVRHGLTKLTDALVRKNITYEQVGSFDEARGKTVIVAGLAYGDGTAAKILKAGNRIVPQVSEALTIWKTAWQKKQVYVISGYDDRGQMYGLLDVAARIGWIENGKNPMSEVREITEKPDVSDRVISIYTMNRAY